LNKNELFNTMNQTDKIEKIYQKFQNLKDNSDFISTQELNE